MPATTDALTPRALRWLFYALLVGLLLCAGKLAIHNPSIKYDLLSLLPQTHDSAAVAAASQRFTAQEGNQLVYVLSANAEAELLLASERVIERMRQVAAIEIENPSRQAEEFLHYTRSLAQYRFTLLRKEQRRYLSETRDTALVLQRERELYRPAAGSLAVTLAEDPLGLFDGYLQDTSVTPVAMYPHGDLLLLEETLGFHALITASVVPGAFDLGAQQQALALDEALTAELRKLHPTVSLKKAGVVFHAGAAAAQAKREVSIIALGSALGIIILFSLAFGSGKPLLLTLGSILFGCTSAALISLSIFQELHLLTLVFGASLIGVAVDYALHTLRHSSTGGSVYLGALMPGMALALLTSLIGFGSLLQAPVPGLQQMALFSMLGLSSAWLFVVVVFPRTAINARPPGQPLLALARMPDALTNHRLARSALLALLVAMIIAGVWQVNSVGDLRVFHQPDDALLQDQTAIETLLPAYSANQFYLVQGQSTEQVLQRAEQVKEELQALEGRSVKSVLTLTDHLPSKLQQEQNREIMAERVYREGGPADQLLSKLGFDATTANKLRSDLAAQPELTPQAWSNFAPAQLQQLLLGEYNGIHYAAIRLAGISDTAPLASIARNRPWLDFVDTVAAISSDLLQRQNKALLQLGAAYILIGLALVARYRQLRALLMLGTPLLSSLATLAVFGLTGQPLTLFHVFGLFLVLGLGMDYSIFRHEAGAQREECMFAILLSMATSALSFGLLALSDTPMISAFGLTVLLGSFGNWLLLPLLETNRQSKTNAQPINN